MSHLRHCSKYGCPPAGHTQSPVRSRCAHVTISPCSCTGHRLQSRHCRMKAIQHSYAPIRMHATVASQILGIFLPLTIVGVLSKAVALMLMVSVLAACAGEHLWSKYSLLQMPKEEEMSQQKLAQLQQQHAALAQGHFAGHI